MSATLKYLLDKEWSMGNGQCPECCGVPASWHGHLLHMTPETIGHKLNCSLAAAIADAKGSPLMIGSYKSTKKFELFISKHGFFGVRPKTKNGCPKYKKWEGKTWDKVFKLLHKDDA